MKKVLLKTLSFFVSLLPDGMIESTYRIIAKPKFLRKLINRTVASVIPEKIRLGRFDFFLNQKDAVVSGSIALGVYEPFETKIFAKSLRPGTTVIDIGANIGYYTLLAAGIAKNVIAFEPDPYNYKWLTKNITENNLVNVTAHQLALTEKTGNTIFYKNVDNFGDRRIYDFKGAESSDRVPTISLDQFLEKNHITFVDLIKIDVQGAEGIALMGMEKILQQPSIEIFIEFFPMGLKLCGTDPTKFLEKLSAYKFRIQHVNEKTHSLELIGNIPKFVSKFKRAEYANLYLQK